MIIYIGFLRYFDSPAKSAFSHASCDAKLVLSDSGPKREAIHESIAVLIEIIMKKSLLRQMISILLAVFAFCTLISVRSRADQEDVSWITVPFCYVEEEGAWDFPYSDDYFRTSSRQFSRELAQASLGLEFSSFRNDDSDLENQYETYLKKAGFTDIAPFGYDQPTAKDSLSGVIACKQIDDFTLIAAAPSGMGYGKEWGGNMEVGDGVRHEGFDKAARILENQIYDFIDETHINGKKKLWVVGFSRTAAVGNLTAADMIESGEFDDIYAYLFAVPRTTKEPVDYPNIFNMCGVFDPVTQIPFQSWGYERYGQDLYTPSEETNTDFAPMAFEASLVAIPLRETFLWNNPEINYQLHTVLEFMAELFPTSSVYVEKFQDILVNMFQDISADDLLEALEIAIAQMKDLDLREQYSSDVFLDYLSYIIAQHTAQDRKQVREVRWNPEEGIADNLMREHMPYTYLSWIFSDTTEEELFYHSVYSRRVVIDGDLDVEVYCDGTLIEGSRRDGELIDASELIDYSAYTDIHDLLTAIPNILAIRNGAKTVITLPVNESFTIKIQSFKITPVHYYEVMCSPYSTFGDMDTISVLLADKDIYYIDADAGSPLSEIYTDSGKKPRVSSVECSYSTTFLMADEASSLGHVSLKTMMQMTLWIGVFIIVLLLCCLVIAIIHSRGKKKGRTYSPLYVIIPHWILILLFSLLTQFFTVNYFAIGTARETCAGITMFLMFLLALRGLYRRRCIRNVVIAGSLLVLSVINFLIYQRSDLVSSSLLNFVLYMFFMAVLAVLAGSTFYSRKTDRLSAEGSRS